MKTPANGDIGFFQVRSKGEGIQEPAVIAQQIKEVQGLLSDEAQRHFMRQVLQKLKEKNALSLAYLKTPSEFIRAIKVKRWNRQQEVHKVKMGFYV